MSTGCSDDGSGGTGGSTSTTTVASSSSSGTGGTGGAGGGAAADCTSYCTTIMANCTGANAQYANMESCMGSCADLPVGEAADTKGNTMGCRTYHAGAAKGDPGLHCEHAGPSGAGACGAICEGFCAMGTMACPTEWPAVGECMTSCMAWTAAAGKYNAMDFTAGNTTQCRLYHLSVAASDAATAMIHCPHTTAMSMPCK